MVDNVISPVPRTVYMDVTNIQKNVTNVRPETREITAMKRVPLVVSHVTRSADHVTSVNLDTGEIIVQNHANPIVITVTNI